MDLPVTLDPSGPPLASQIHEALVAAILDGRLAAGARLPSTRALARDLGVARTTVVYAYERLVAEGYATSRVGAGTFVGTDHLPAGVAPDPTGTRDLTLPAGWQDRTGWVPGPHPEPAVADLGVGVPDPGLFPLTTWRRLVAHELRATAPLDGRYGDPAGLPELRAALARHIGLARSVRCTADDVVVTRGAQQAFDLLARVLVTPGTVVAVEEPGYPPVRQLLEALGAEVVGVPVTDQGLDVASLPEAARLVHVTPSHQFPLGTPMSLATRTALLAWAEAHDAVVVEDDYDSEFRFTARPLAPLHHLDRSGRVAYVATFSKTLLPGLRLGFVVAPPGLRRAVVAAKSLADGFTDPVVQRALTRFVDEGHLAHHLRRARRVYARRRELVAQALAGPLAPWLEAVPAAAGLHLTARLRPGVGVDLPAVVRRAAARGVRVERLADYAAGPSSDGLVLGYGAAGEAAITAGLAVLHDCLAGR